MSENNLVNPLKLKFSGGEYKVNKSNEQSGEYVDKDIADALAVSLKKLLSWSAHFPQAMNNDIEKANEALQKAVG